MGHRLGGLCGGAHTLWLPALLQPEALPLSQAAADKCLPRRHSNPPQQVWLSLCGVSVSWCAHSFVWGLQASLVHMGFDSKCDFTCPTTLLGLLLCSWTWGIFPWWDPIFSCRWLFRSELQFWSSCRRRWAHVLLLCHLVFAFFTHMYCFLPVIPKYETLQMEQKSFLTCCFVYHTFTSCLFCFIFRN